MVHVGLLMHKKTVDKIKINTDKKCAINETVIITNFAQYVHDV